MVYVKEENAIIYAECEECGHILKFRKGTLKFNPQSCMYTLPEQVECFCETIHQRIKDCPKPITPENNNRSVLSTQNTNVRIVSTPPEPDVHIPRCPTCRSMNVQRISIVTKAIDGYLFGLFSSSVRNTYECNNCKYRW